MVEDKKMNELVEKRIIKMIADEPTTVILFMLSRMGKMVVESNADDMDLKTEATYNKVRYEVKAKITVKKIKNP